MNRSTKPTAAEVAELIRALARSYVGKPDLVEVKFQEATDGGAAYFILRGAPDDDSRLVGRSGCHVNALTYLVDQVGRAQGKVFTFRLITKPDGHTPWYPPQAALEYEPTAAKELLARWLSALGLSEFDLAVTAGDGPRRSLFFNFDVSVENRSEAEALFAATEGEASIVGSLGTLWRAISKQAGVRFQIRLVDGAAKLR